MNTILKPTLFILPFFFINLAKAQVIDPETEAYRAGQMIVVGPGNHNKTMPEIPETTRKRHADKIRAAGGQEAYFTGQFNNVIATLKSKYETENFSLKQEVKLAGSLYGINPVHILSAIAGEHIFNVPLQMNVQEYSVRFGIWVGYYKGEHPFAAITKCSEMAICENTSSSYEMYACYEKRWDELFRNRLACGQSTPFANSGLMMAYFNPQLAGKTYGIGQLSPLRILAVEDLVAQKSGFPRLNIHNVDDVYRATLNPRLAVHYIAANIYMAIQVYRENAHFDISQNPGITATLYNLGREKRKAGELTQLNLKNLKSGQSIQKPQENYYGWLINRFQKEIQSLLN